MSNVALELLGIDTTDLSEEQSTRIFNALKNAGQVLFSIFKDKSSEKYNKILSDYLGISSGKIENILKPFVLGDEEEFIPATTENDYVSREEFNKFQDKILDCLSNKLKNSHEISDSLFPSSSSSSSLSPPLDLDLILPLPLEEKKLKEKKKEKTRKKKKKKKKKIIPFFENFNSSWCTIMGESVSWNNAGNHSILFTQTFGNGILRFEFVFEMKAAAVGICDFSWYEGEEKPWMGNDSNSLDWNPNGYIYHAGNDNSVPSFSETDKISMELNMVNHTLLFFLNDVMISVKISNIPALVKAGFCIVDEGKCSPSICMVTFPSLPTTDLTDIFW